jgi:hypothetical protein
MEGKFKDIDDVIVVDTGEGDEGDEDENENDDDGWVLLTPIETPPLLPKIQAAPMVQPNSTSSSSSRVKIKSRSKKTNKKPAETPHFPFSSSVDDTLLQEEDFENREEVMVVQANGTKHYRMHTAHARDGGRTQSGGG